MRREFLMQSQTYDMAKHRVAGMFTSEKLDGVRAIWLPGTRGQKVKDIGWGSQKKDEGNKIATGLWTRYGKVVNAPAWWVENLPQYPLDGELWMGRKLFAETVSVVRSFEDKGWGDVRYMVFDSPLYSMIYQMGKVESQHFKKVFTGHVPFEDKYEYKYFEQVYKRLKADQYNWGKYAVLHQLELLPFDTLLALQQLEEIVDAVCSRDGEGVILRHPSAAWEPLRSRFSLKVKPYQDAEGTVMGYKPGKGKYQGMLGSLTVQFNSVQFDLSGFTDSERQNAEQLFPVGTLVSFKYRELTNDGIPKEARFYRKRDGSL